MSVGRWPKSGAANGPRHPQRGRQVEPRNAYRSFDRIADSAGVRVVRLHDWWPLPYGERASNCPYSRRTRTRWRQACGPARNTGATGEADARRRIRADLLVLDAGTGRLLHTLRLPAMAVPDADDYDVKLDVGEFADGAVAISRRDEEGDLLIATD